MVHSIIFQTGPGQWPVVNGQRPAACDVICVALNIALCVQRGCGRQFDAALHDSPKGLTVRDMFENLLQILEIILKTF